MALSLESLSGFWQKALDMGEKAGKIKICSTSALRHEKCYPRVPFWADDSHLRCMNIQGVKGLLPGQRSSLRMLGAVEATQ